MNLSKGEVMIEIINVRKSFKQEEVLKGISETFLSGEITGIVGRNGSGKTVLFKLISGLLKPDEGEIIVDGVHIGKDADFPKSIGVIIETPEFIGYQSGFDNLKNLAVIQGKITDEKIHEVMELVGLQEVGKKKVSKYSLGMRQRLGIAQAIMEEPDVLILDEPMNGLDKEGVQEVRQLLLKLKKENRTIIIASHHAEDIEQLCDTVYEMDKGVLTKQ